MDSNLTPEQWGAAWRLYEAVADLPEPGREQLLESSAEDPSVIRQVRTLLESSDGQIPAEPVSRTGSRVSHYSVGERIGRGGMGEVYEARDLELDRAVAIKFLPEHMLGEERAVRRFLAEAKAASALNHPNLVTIHEFVREDGLLAIVMERIEGQTLRRMPPGADAGGSGLRECLRRLAQLAEALAAAHAQGIIHRDLKPENIMVRSDGYVKILDFGLAVLAERAIPVPGDGTAFSTAAGTPRYMSPEQKRNETLTPASDIYSLGLVFMEMLTGSADPAQLAAPGLRVPGTAARLVSSMMAPDASKRPSAAEVARAADRLAADRRRWPWWTAAALAAFLAAVWVWRAGPAPAPGQALTVLRLTALPGEELSPSFSPDGAQVAFSWNGDRGDNTDIYVMRLGDRSVRRLTNHPAEDSSPIWSPDGKTIAFTRHTGPLVKKAVHLVPAEGGQEREIGVAYGTLFGDWSPDGRWLVVRGGPGLALIEAQTGESRPLLQGDGAAFVTPAFSPDGRRIAFSRDRLGIAELMVLPLTADLKAAGPAQVLRLAGLRNEECSNPRWTADGRSLVFTFSRGGAKRLWLVRLPEDLAREVTPELIDVGEGIESAALSGRTRRLVFAQVRSDANLWRVPLEGGGLPRKWVASSRDDRQGDVRADGRIVFESDRSGFREIWVTEPDGTGARALTNFGGPMTGSPRWSPDGRTIAFDTRRDGHPQIYAMDVPGPGEALAPVLPVARRVTQSGEQNVVPAWSPDGRWIYFQSLRAGAERICRVRAGGGEVQVISPGFGRAPAPSADGKWVYYARLGDYWRCPAAGGPEELVAKRVVVRTAVPVVGGLWFLRTDGMETQIVYRDEKTGAERIAARYEGRREGSLAISRDQKYALVTRLDEGQADLMLVENFDPR